MRSISSLAVALCAAATTPAFAQIPTTDPTVNTNVLFNQQLQIVISQYQLLAVQLEALQLQLAATQPAALQLPGEAQSTQGNGCSHQPVSKE